MSGRERIQCALWGIALVAVVGLTLPTIPKSASSSALNVPFSWLLETIRVGDALPVYPSKLLALDGERVSISGFVTPYDDPQIATKLLLSEGGGGCFFCAPPRANGVVLVRRESHVPLSLWQNGPLRFEGKLHLIHAGSDDDEANQFLFSLDEAALVQNAIPQ